MAGRRLPNGETLFVTNQFQNPGAARAANCFRLDAKGKDTGKSLNFNWIQQLQNIDVVGEDRILVCEKDITGPGRQIDRVSEYDFKTGKQTWSYECPQNSAPTSAQRLPNGNTLICLMNLNKLIEVDPSGEVVWEYAAQDGLKVGRAYRR
jgi:outer membrane protein assembly factor BamB